MGRFETVDATVRRGDADGAATVGAVGDGNQPGAYCVGGTARRPARVVVRIMWVERSPVGWVVIGGI